MTTGYDSVGPHFQPSPSSPLLTLAMIVKDGGQFLAPLLGAAAEWVDEIVIGDTGSRDGSREVAGLAGAKVLEVPWRNDFAAARNEVLDHCAGRWILVLDADEQLAPRDWQGIRAWVENRHRVAGPAAASLVTRNYLPGRHRRRGWRPLPEPDPHALPGRPRPAPGFTPSAKVRIFPRHPAIRFRGCIHETVEDGVRRSGLAVIDLEHPVHHFGHLQEDPAKAQFYREIARTKTEQEPQNPRAWSELADCAIACGDLGEAVAAIDRALIIEPVDPDRRLTAGWLLLQQGKLDQADAQLASVAGGGGADDLQLAEACHLRAQVALRQDRGETAGRLLAVALHLFPDNGHYQNTLGVWHLAHGRGDKARMALERAAGLLPGCADPWLNLGKMYEAAGMPQTAEEHFRRARLEDPRVPVPGCA
ncbi:MAG: tetratricopeptide repeat protein [Candidatus Krumholzibacteriia bacterium]